MDEALLTAMVNDPRWHWHVGMRGRDLYTNQMVTVYRRTHKTVWYITDKHRTIQMLCKRVRILPDLEHPAVKGWLLSLVRTNPAWGVDVVAVRNDSSMLYLRSSPGSQRWRVATRAVPFPVAYGDTEGDALARAVCVGWELVQPPDSWELPA